MVLGDPDKIEPVVVTSETRFALLNGRLIDALIYGEYNTLRRQVSEVCAITMLTATT